MTARAKTLGLAAGESDFFAFFSATTDGDPANGIFVPIRKVETGASDPMAALAP